MFGWVMRAEQTSDFIMTERQVFSPDKPGKRVRSGDKCGKHLVRHPSSLHQDEANVSGSCGKTIDPTWAPRVGNMVKIYKCGSLFFFNWLMNGWEHARLCSRWKCDLTLKTTLKLDLLLLHLHCLDSDSPPSAPPNALEARTHFYCISFV